MVIIKRIKLNYGNYIVTKRKLSHNLASSVKCVQMCILIHLSQRGSFNILFYTFYVFAGQPGTQGRTLWEPKLRWEEDWDHRWWCSQLPRSWIPWESLFSSCAEWHVSKTSKSADMSTVNSHFRQFLTLSRLIFKCSPVVIVLVHFLLLSRFQLGGLSVPRIQRLPVLVWERRV